MKKPFFSRIFLALACTGLLVLPAQAAEMTVSGAASLTNAFTELKGMFEKRHADLKVNVNFAASNPLLKQLQEGAPIASGEKDNGGQHDQGEQHPDQDGPGGHEQGHGHGSRYRYQPRSKKRRQRDAGGGCGCG